MRWTDVDGGGTRTITEAERIAGQIQQDLPRLKGGTLRFWGQWFGRPHDNHHSIVNCSAQGDLLRLTFNEQEVLSIWEPKGATFTDGFLRVGKASRVRWEWFYYGRPKTPANLYHEEYVASETGISASTNADWYVPDLRPDPSSPAVEIV